MRELEEFGSAGVRGMGGVARVEGVQGLVVVAHSGARSGRD